MSLPDFLIEHRDDILEHITDVVSDLKEQLQADPDAFTDQGSCDPFIDIRLCVYWSGDGKGSWQVFTGDVSYDQVHWPHCGASSVELDTDPSELLNELFDQILEGDI